MVGGAEGAEGDLTQVGVLRRTAVGRHHGDDKGIPPVGHGNANQGGVVADNVVDRRYLVFSGFTPAAIW